MSDTFLENGIGILVKNCRKAGYNVVVEDWANETFYNNISPKVLSKINRLLYKKLLFGKNWRYPKIITRLIGFIALTNQNLLEMYLNFMTHKHLSKVAKRISREKIPLLGIKVWYGDGYKWSNELVKKVNKSSPETVTIAGGPHPTIYQEELLKHSNFDFAIVSEGEYALVDILSIARNGRTKSEIVDEINKAAEKNKIKNLIYRDNGIIKKSECKRLDIASKEIPEYTNLNSKVKVHIIIDSLGCPYGECSFCVHAKFYRYQSRDPEQVVEEIKLMLKKGIGIFRLAGSGPHLGAVSKIAKKILENKLNIIFSMFGMVVPKAKNPERYIKLVKTYELLIKAGLRAVFFGAETGNDLVLREAMGKIVTREDLIYTVKALREASQNIGINVDIGLSFIYPVPTLGKVDLKQVYNDNIELAKAMSPDSILCSPPGPFKYTEWYENHDKYGFTMGDNFLSEMLNYEYVLYKPLNMWKDINISLDGIRGKGLLEKCQEMRKGFESLGFPTEITDEHFLLLRNAGYRDKAGVEIFKRETLLDIISCNYDFTNKIYKEFNKVSEMIAESNKINNATPLINKPIQKIFEEKSIYK
ncbi:MAG: B12-binding domain-containing radical SAM protein [Candidatus Helarchaeota archaeon]|nr:B12-binding domain-containing radical SAM protein [Candidatus Helarchaeota archaeon]